MFFHICCIKVRVMEDMGILTTVCLDGSTVIGEIALAMRDLSRGRSMEKEFALTPKGYLKVLMYLSLSHGMFGGHYW